MPYVVESPIFDQRTQRGGTIRVWVATEERAKEIAAQHPERTYRQVSIEEMHPKARANLAR